MLKKILSFLVPAVTAITAGGLHHLGNDTNGVKTGVKVTTNAKVSTNVKVNVNTSKKTSGSISREAAGEVNSFRFDSLGNVTVIGGEEECAGCELSYEIQGPSQEICDLISGSLDVKCSIEDGVLSIDYYCGGVKLNSSIEELYEGYNLSADLTVRVPDSVKDQSIRTSIGNITLINVSGYFDLNTSLGNVSLDTVRSSDGSVFKTQLGNITAESLALDGSGELSAVQGNITVNSNQLELRDGAICSKEAPGNELAVSTGLGNIRFNNNKI